VVLTPSVFSPGVARWVANRMSTPSVLIPDLVAIARGWTLGSATPIMPDFAYERRNVLRIATLLARLLVGKKVTQNSGGGPRPIKCRRRVAPMRRDEQVARRGRLETVLGQELGRAIPAMGSFRRGNRSGTRLLAKMDPSQPFL